MGVLVAFPVLIACMMLQMVVVKDLTIINGSADIILVVLAAWALHERVTTAWEWGVIGGLMVSFTSAMPVMTPLVSYLVVIGLARLLHMRIWQVPVLAMLVVTIVGTLFQHTFSILVLKYFNDIPLAWVESLRYVTLPSLLINLLLSVPIYALMTNLAESIYPGENEL